MCSGRMGLEAIMQVYRDDRASLQHFTDTFSAELRRIERAMKQSGAWAAL